MSDPPVFVRRCRVCGAELQTPWGPETHSESARTLSEHIATHTNYELLDYALRSHGESRDVGSPRAVVGSMGHSENLPADLEGLISGGAPVPVEEQGASLLNADVREEQQGGGE